MPNRPSIPWRLKAVACLASASLSLALVALTAPSISAQQKPAAPSRFVQPEPIDFDDHDGWTQIFDGKTLNGWDGPAEVWHLEDGAIVGESSARSIPRGQPTSAGAAVSRGTSCSR